MARFGSVPEQFIIEQARRQKDLFWWVRKLLNDGISTTPADIDARHWDLDYLWEVKSCRMKENGYDFIAVNDRLRRQVKEGMQYVEKHPMRARAGFFFVFYHSKARILPNDFIYFMFVEQVNYILKLLDNPDTKTRNISKFGLTKTKIKKEFFFEVRCKIPSSMDNVEFQIIKIPITATVNGLGRIDLSPIIHARQYQPYKQDLTPLTTEITKKFSSKSKNLFERDNI